MTRSSLLASFVLAAGILAGYWGAHVARGCEVGNAHGCIHLIEDRTYNRPTDPGWVVWAAASSQH